MEFRFIRWTLLLLLLTIVATEGLRGPGTRADDEKRLAVRARGGSRFSSRKSGSESTSETTTPSSDTKSTTKSGRFASTRKTASKRFGGGGGGNNGGHTAADSVTRASTASTVASSKSTTEHNLPKSRIEAALQRRADKLKAASQKSHPPGIVRLPNRKLGQKVPIAETEKSPSINATESIETEDSNKEGEERKYLPDGLSDEAKTAQEQEQVDGIDLPKVSEAPPRTGGLRSGRLIGDRSKQKSEQPVFTTPSDARLRTGRKIQSQSVLTAKQLKSNVPSSSRFSKTKVSEEPEVETTTEPMESNRRSFDVDSDDPDESLVDSHKLDIAASGSESVRINIPLSFEDSKKIGASSSADSSSSEPPKRFSNLRYKSRTRQPSNDKKSEPEVSSTSAPTSRVPSRRLKGNRNQDSSTESASSDSSTTGRTRGRIYDKKSNSIPDSSPSTAQPDLRRRNYNNKSTARPTEPTKGLDNNKLSAAKNHNLDHKKLLRSRGRYRVDATTTAGTVQASSIQASIDSDVATNFGAVTPFYESKISVTPSALTSQATTTPRVPVSSLSSVANVNSENIKKDGEETENNGVRRRASKEDFFNHGLGFRGRRPPFPGTPEVPATVTTSTASIPSSVATTARLDTTARGNPGWTLRRRPGHWQDGPPSGPSANPAESPIPTEQDRPTTTIIADLETTMKSGRRGNKVFSKTNAAGEKVSDETNDDENYPPDFKARIAQSQLTAAQPKPQSEEPQLQTTSNVTSSASADLEFAPSENEYVMVTQTDDPISTTTLSLQIPSVVEEQQASKTASEIFAARSRMKLENARKLVKPELIIDETNARQVYVDPSVKYIEEPEKDQSHPNDSEVDEDQRVIKVARKPSPSTEKSQKGSPTKSDWKPSKLRKEPKDSQARTSRYKQTHVYTSRPAKLTNSEKSNLALEENDVEHTTSRSARVSRYYQELKHKYLPKPRDGKLRGPKPSGHIERPIEEPPTSTSKPAAAEKPRKMSMKSDKSYIEDVKAVAMKLRKTLESMDKNQTARPARRSDSSESSGSTTLLTTMRTVKSFSFSTRLVKMDENEPASSSTTAKMLEGQQGGETNDGVPTSISLVTEIVTLNPLENEVSTSKYENVLASSNRPNDLINEIENSSGASSSTSEPPQFGKSSSLDNLIEPEVDYKPHVAALVNDTGSPVFVVYPSATEKPLSIAITPKVYKYQATAKPPDDSKQQPAMQEPVISVKVSSSSSSGGDAANGSNDGATNVFNPVESAAILETGNITILEQLRSTVAPLLGTLGAKSPVFSAVYKNTNSANSIPRVTPSGAPPRFSARYRGAELFIRKPTPPTISLPENIDSPPRIDVSSPGEPKVLTFYQAVESASINNEQTDVRQLWPLNQAAQVENITVNDTYDTNNFNNDSLPLTPVTNTINDTVPSLTDNVTTSPFDTTEFLQTTTNIETTQPTIQSLETNEPRQTNNSSTAAEFPSELKEITSTTVDFSTTLNGQLATESITESIMSTSTELVTEVSVSISDTMSSSRATSISTPISSEITSFNSDTTEKSTIFQTTENTLEESSTETFATSTLDNVEKMSISTTEATAVNTITEIENSRSAKKLDDSNFEQPEVSNSLLDITLPSNDNETTKPTIVEIQITQEPSRNSKLEILSQVKSAEISDALNSTTENTIITLNTLVMLDNITTYQPMSETEGTTILPKSLLTEVPITNTSIDTETVPEFILNSTTESTNLTEIMPNTNSPLIINLISQEDQKTTIQLSETTESIRNENVTDLNNNVNTLDVEIQIYNDTNTTVPAGTEQLTSTKDSNYEDNKMALEKLLYSVLNENTTSNNFSNNIFMAELMKIVGRFSDNSTNATQSSFNLDENNVDSSPDGLPQLLGGFLDNTNKTLSVTNDSTVENNSETSVDTQTTNIPSTILPEQFTNSKNTDTNTEINSKFYDDITQTNNDALETTTFFPITTDSVININNNSTNITNAYSYNLSRMMDIFTKLLGIKSLLGTPTDALTPELDSLTLNSTESLSVDEVTLTTLIDDSINLVSTTVSIENQTTPDLTTIFPTLLTRFQDSSKATAQRTAGINKRPNQTFTTLKPTKNYPSSFAFSLNTINTNDPSAKTSQSSDPAKTTTNPEKNSANKSTSSYSSANKGLLSRYPSIVAPTIQQSTTASSVGRFGTSRLTPAPKFSSSSSTTAPLRDYLIYGIFPNKTIVRKRPEDNLIDARNVDSPYVIFGIYPDGKLVRKFPNGTIIPDPPSNPVEVVFSPETTTTTNKPRLPDNQANNQGMRNQNVNFSNNRNSVDDVNTQKAFFAPNEVDNALSVSGPIGFDLPIASVTSNTKKTTTTVANAAMGNQSQQNGRIIQDQTRNEATKTNVSEGHRSSVSVSQDKLVNYWSDGQPNSIPKVLSVNINSAAAAIKENPQSSPPVAINLDILPNSQSGSQVTAPPGFPWKDPLDQIFGIPTDSPVLTGSVASNTIDDANAARPANKPVEIFSPVSSTINSLINNPTKATTSTTTTTTTPVPTTQTSPSTTSTTTTQASTTIPSSTTTTVKPITMNPNAFGTTFDDLAFLNALLEKPNPPVNGVTPKTLNEVEQLLANKILSLALGRPLTNEGPTRSPKAIQFSNASPNSLGDSKGSRSTSSPSFVGSSSEPIIIDLQTSTTKRPPPTTTTAFTWKPVRTFIDFDDTPLKSTTPSTTTTTTTTTTTMRTTTSTLPTTTTTTTTTPKTTTTPSTTTTVTQTSSRAPVIITAKPATTRRPRPITQPPPAGPFAFAANILQNIFGRNLFNPFAPQTTARPLVRRPTVTARKTTLTTKATTTAPTTSATTSTTTTTTTRAPFVVLAQSSHTPRSINVANSVVDVTNGQLSASSNAIGTSERSVEVTPRSAGTRSSTTFSPEDDAKFLAALLNAARSMGDKNGISPETGSNKPALDADDEAFLRSILNGQAKIKPLSTVGGNDQNDAALLAAFLKTQGIEPSTPESLREQIQKATQTTTTATTQRPTTRRTTRTQRRPQGSTYPAPLFNFGAFGSSAGNGGGGDFADGAEGTVRSQVVNAAIGMTRAFGQFLGAAITGASQQFQTFFRNRTTWG